MKSWSHLCVTQWSTHTFPLQACFYETCWVCIYHHSYISWVRGTKHGVTRIWMNCWYFCRFHLSVTDHLTDFRAHVLHVLVRLNEKWGCAYHCWCMCVQDRRSRMVCVCEWVNEADGELSVIPSVSPLHLNLLAPHGMSQSGMGLNFACKAQRGVFFKVALLRHDFTCLFLPSYGLRLDAQADHPDVGVSTNVFINVIASLLQSLVD